MKIIKQSAMFAPGLHNARIRLYYIRCSRINKSSVFPHRDASRLDCISLGGSDVKCIQYQHAGINNRALLLL